jgi:hypothetical protein
MRPSDTYATFNGVEYRVVSSGMHDDGQRYVGLRLDPSQPTAGFENVVERPALGDRIAIVPTSALDKYERVVTTGHYDGEQVWINGPMEGPQPARAKESQRARGHQRVTCGFLGSPHWAAEHGFSGSRHDGWVGEVGVDEITDIEEHVTDLLAAR